MGVHAAPPHHTTTPDPRLRRLPRGRLLRRPLPGHRGCERRRLRLDPPDSPAFGRRALPIPPTTPGHALPARPLYLGLHHRAPRRRDRLSLRHLLLWRRPRSQARRDRTLPPAPLL